MPCFRPVLLTATGCLYWTAGLFVAVYAVCHYWSINDCCTVPQYCIWYQKSFSNFQWYLAAACFSVSLFCKKDLPGIFLYLMATQGLVFGLVQAPFPESSDLCFKKPGTAFYVEGHTGESLGYKSAILSDIEENSGFILPCKSCVYKVSAVEGKHVAGIAVLENMKGLSISNIGKYLKNGIFSRLRIDDSVEKYCPHVEPIFISIRKNMVEKHIQALGKTRGTLLSSIVLGDKVVDLPSFVKGNFRRSGVSHLLAASGFNLSIFVASICLCLRFCTRSAIACAIAGMLATISFVLLAGTSPSVIRAAVWAILLLVLKLTYRRVHMGALFSFAMFIHLVLDPFSVLDIGWQLSYAATASIICGVEYFGREKKFFVWRWFKSTVSVILMAQAAVLPLACLYFKQINLLFLASNLFLDPLVAPLTILGFASSWFCLLSPELAHWLDLLAYFPLEYMLFITKYFASLKFSQLNIAPPPGWILCEYTASLMYFVLERQRKKGQEKFACLVYLLSLALLLLASICP